MQIFLQISNLYWRIILLQARPQDVPAASAVLAGTVAVLLVANMVALTPRFGAPIAFLLILLDIALLTLLLRMALNLIGKPERFVQSFSALCGTNAWFALLSFPLLLVVQRAGGVEHTSPMVTLLILVLHAWSVMVIGYIFRHSFEVRFALGVVIAIAYIFAVMMIVELLLPLLGFVENAPAGAS